ncbi:MAG: hypothetical protein EXS13_04485 [Planctomycetes bacterium]|nr:hypothetical protein [Planctomycetota bacterium]
MIALGLLARIVRYGVDFPIWGDEAFVGCSLLARDLKGLLEPLEFEMVVPLGWLLPTGWLVQQFGSSTFVVRLPALLAGCAALLLFARLGRRTLPRATALLAVAWFGGSYYLIRHTAEVKPYAFDLLAGVLLYGAALRVAAALARAEQGDSAVGDEASRRAMDASARRAWLAFTAIGVTAVWCSYPAIFVAAGTGVTLAVRAVAPGFRAPTLEMRRRCSRIGIVLLGGAAIVASFAVMYALFGHAQQWTEERIADARHWDDHFLPVARPWLWPWWLLCELTGNMLAYPNGGPNFGSSATFVLVVAGAIAWWRRGRQVELALLLAPLLPMLVASALHKYPFGGSARITLHLAVPICLLAASGIAAIARRAHTATPIATLVLALFAIGSIARDLRKPWKTEQDRRSRAAFEWLATQLAPGDRLAIFGSYGESTVAPDLRHWRGSAGRLRWYLLQLAREQSVELAWAPEPAALVATRFATWSVTYRDNEAPFPDAQHDAWIATLAQSLAPVSLEREFELGAASPDSTTGAPRSERITFARR